MDLNLGSTYGFDLLGRRFSFDKFDLGFVLVLLVLLYTQFNVLSQFKQIPSPLYGGDFYNGLGGVLHIMDGGNLFASAQMLGEIPWVPWLYHLSVATFAGISGLDAVHALLYFSLVIQLLASVILYKLITYSQDDMKMKLVAIAGVVILTTFFPVIKYSEFATYLTIPAFILSLVWFFNSPSLNRAVVSGILFGLCALSNTQAFFFVMILLFVYFACRLVFDGKLKASMLSDETAVFQLKSLAVIFVLGMLISMLYWYTPIFVYKGNTPNNIQDITTPDVTLPSVLWAGITDLLGQRILPFGTGAPIYIVLSLLCLVGIIYTLLYFRKDAFALLLLILLVTQLACILHPLITLPLFHKHLVNFMMSDRIANVLTILLIAGGLKFIFSKLPAYVKSGPETAAILLALILIFVSALALSQQMANYESNQWTAAGKQEFAPYYVELSQWIRYNTGVSDVFLATNEDSFMMNAISGRKSITYRRTHTSPYTDVNTRMRDQAEMAYGSNDQERVRLLKKYNVKYLLWTDRWLLNEFQINQEGAVVGFFDPLAIPGNDTNKVYWQAMGVKYLEVSMPLDPAPRQNAPIYDVLVAFPSEPSMDAPFSSQLLGHFTLVKTITYQGQDVFRIYRIN